MDHDSLLQYGTTIERDMQAHANALATRVSTWALAGHGAGLLLCFNALAAHQICDWAAVKPIAQLFAAGMVCAGGSVIFTMRVFELAAARMLRINSAMRGATADINLLNEANAAVNQTDVNARAEVLTVARNAESAAREKMAQIDKLSEIPGPERMLAAAGNGALVTSLLFFGLALFDAVWGVGLAKSLCPAVG